MYVHKPGATPPLLEEVDRESIIHPFTNLRLFESGAMGGPRIIEEGNGITVKDQHGKRYLDAFGGLYCVNVGYGRREIADAIHEQAKKIAWYYNNILGRKDKKKIISRHRGYHGATIMSGSLTGLPVFHTAFDLPIGPVLHTSTPHYYWRGKPDESEYEFAKRCAEELEAMIVAEGADTIAAFIAEPMLGTGGLIPPPEGYWPLVQAVLEKYDVLLIVDEVVCGFGRMGTAFGCHYYGIKPDMMTMAKGLTSAYLPLSGAVVSDKIWRVLEQGSDRFGPFAHGYTYSAHPLCAAAGLANLEILEEERIIDHVATVSPFLVKALMDRLRGHPFVGEIRGAGMLAAVEFVADREKKIRFDPSEALGGKLAAACFERGLIARAMPHGDILGFAPPLIITQTEIDQVADIVQDAINSIF